VAETVGTHDLVGTGALALLPYARESIGARARELFPVHCANAACRAVLGYSDGSVLSMGEVEIHEAVRLTHTRCGCDTVWSPKLDGAPPPQAARGKGTLAPFHCRRKKCKGVVGYTDGCRLVIGEVELRSRTRFIHTRCGHFTTWYPVGR